MKNIILILFFVSLIYSCKKDSDTNPANNKPAPTSQIPNSIYGTYTGEVNIDRINNVPHQGHYPGSKVVVMPYTSTQVKIAFAAFWHSDTLIVDVDDYQLTIKPQKMCPTCYEHSGGGTYSDPVLGFMFGSSRYESGFVHQTVYHSDYNMTK